MHFLSPDVIMQHKLSASTNLIENSLLLTEDPTGRLRPGTLLFLCLD